MESKQWSCFSSLTSDCFYYYYYDDEILRDGTWLWVWAEAGVRSTSRPWPPQFGRSFSGQSRQIMYGLEEGQDGVNKGGCSLPCPWTMVRRPPCIFTVSATFFFFNLKVGLSRFKVTVHPCPRCDSQERSAHLWAREKQKLSVISSGPTGSRWRERRNKEVKRKGEKKRASGEGAASGGKGGKGGSNGWQHKGWFSLCFSAPLISELQPAYILIHYSWSDHERLRAGKEGGKAKARDSSNHSRFKWHWVTEPGVLWLAAQMRHCAVCTSSTLAPR